MGGECRRTENKIIKSSYAQFLIICRFAKFCASNIDLIVFEKFCSSLIVFHVKFVVVVVYQCTIINVSVWRLKLFCIARFTLCQNSSHNRNYKLVLCIVYVEYFFLRRKNFILYNFRTRWTRRARPDSETTLSGQIFIISKFLNTRLSYTSRLDTELYFHRSVSK